MKKIIALIGLIFMVNAVFAQNNTTALEIVKILHDNDLDNRKLVIQERRDSLNTKKAVHKAINYKNDIYSKLAQQYSNQYTAEELNSLLAFYKSSLGKKVLENKTKNADTLSSLVSKVRRKQIEERREKIKKIRSEKLEEDKTLTKSNTSSPKKIIEDTVYPEIKTLEDFRKILIKNPRLIRDFKLLKKILGDDVDINKLMHPEHQ